MTTAEALANVQRKYFITNAVFDGDINDCVATAVDLLSSYVKLPTVDTFLVVSGADTTYIEPTTLTDDVDLVALSVSSNGSLPESYTDYTRKGNRILLKTWLSDNTDVTLYLKVPFTVTTIESIPAVYTRPMIDLACSEFATMLAGSKSRYNIYSQNSGARAVDNMIDLAEYYENKALQRLQRLSNGGGVS